MRQPEEMTIAEYNEQMMDDAFKMLMGYLADADEQLNEARKSIDNAKWQATKMKAAAHRRKEKQNESSKF